MNKQTWHQKAYDMLHSKSQTVAQIVAGTGLNYRWVYRFKHDEIPAPDVNKVNELHDYLKRRK